MASSFSAEAHGVRVVTQIIPLSPEPVQCSSESEQKNKTEAFYIARMAIKGEPVALATVQIMIGIIMICMGAITWFTQTLAGEIPLGLGLSFVFSGSVTLCAHKGTCRPANKSVIPLNIFSALLAISGICYFCFAFTVQTDLGSCTTSEDSYYGYYYYDCGYVADRLKKVLIGIKSILLILSVLEVCVCTTTVIYSCKANSQASLTKTDQESVVQGKCSSQEALLNVEVASPPAYEP